jgi:hypothetical protein
MRRSKFGRPRSIKRTKAERYRAWQNNERERAEVFNAYGGKCSRCPEGDWNVLAVHHIHHDGKAHRESENLRAGTEFYRWLKKVGWPVDLVELVCSNCHKRETKAMLDEDRRQEYQLLLSWPGL